ncbi:MAG: ribosomal-protein-alanine N-acetyltransferase [Streptosporangiales bacterium]|nr:ribosomal-protein-alanine N-acetyltransferase [Streptosporangiales bacterium]
MASGTERSGTGEWGNVSLRPMVEDDLGPVLAIERALFPEDAWTEGMFRNELAGRSSRHYLVAEEDGKVVGYAGLFAHRRAADVQTIAVRSGLWGRGVGTTLLAALLEEAERRGCGEVYLDVRADNDRAQRLYQRFGFERIGVRRGYYEQAGVDAVVMRRTRASGSEKRG